VDAARFPKAKEENWWLVVGEPKTNKLIAIKRVALGKRSKVKLEFAAPEETGSYTYLLYFMCDSYLGCDQEYELSFDVKEGEDDSGGEEEDTENDAMKE
jgi:pre-mRNA-splicing helicase BRR2